MGRCTRDLQIGRHRGRGFLGIVAGDQHAASRRAARDADRAAPGVRAGHGLYRAAPVAPAQRPRRQHERAVRPPGAFRRMVHARAAWATAAASSSASSTANISASCSSVRRRAPASGWRWSRTRRSSADGRRRRRDGRAGHGRQLSVDALVVAVGNLPPHAPPGLDPDALPGDLYAPDPWDSGGGRRADRRRHGHADRHRADDGRRRAVARRGGVRGQDRRAVAARAAAAPARRRRGRRATATRSRRRWPAALLAEVRDARRRGIGWRAAVDELRPFTQGLWLSASDEQRGRFLRHLRPWWDVHRHRLAPAVAGQDRRR